MSIPPGSGRTGPRREPARTAAAAEAAGNWQSGGPSALAGEPAGDVAGSIAELQRLLLETDGVEEFLCGMAGLAAGLLPDGLSCGMAVESDGKPITAACSDEVASQVDEVQFLLGEGPCLEALREQRVICVEDTAEPTPWQGFAPQAVAYGIRSCLCLPLASGGRTIGVLNLYSPAPNAFGTGERRAAEEFAGHASGALAVAMRLAAYTSLVEHLRTSMATRAVIDQALGAVMARRRCTQAEAFGVLRTASQRRNVKLRELAREIVTEVSGEAPQPPPFAGG